MIKTPNLSHKSLQQNKGNQEHMIFKNILTSIGVLSDKIRFSCNTAIVFSTTIFEIKVANSFKKAASCSLHQLPPPGTK